MTAPLAQQPGDGIQQRQEGVQDQPVWPRLADDKRPGDPERGLRLWPGLGIAALATGVLAAMPYATDNVLARFMTMFWGPVLATVLVLIWWLAASRARWGDRLRFPALFAAAGGIGLLAVHPSFRFGLIFFGLWAASVAWPVWLLLSRNLPMPARRIGFAAAMLLAFGACALFRMDGVDGSIGTEVSWRFAPTAEDRYMAELAQRQKAAAGGALAADAGDWTGFRGERRDGAARGARIARTDWSSAPPKELWKQRVGPGWSSVAVVGDRLFTQEQQDKVEAVVCYEASTGKAVWTHSDQERFYELVAGAGPRATPTFHEGRIYSLGANGTLNCLDAATGQRVWKADIAKDSGAKVPTWGFSASPCVAHGLVSVYAGGEGMAVVAYDALTGKLAWASGKGGHSYCSTQLATLAGKEVLLAASGPNLLGLDPKSGATLIDYPWPMQEGMARCVQTPTVSADEVLLGSGFGQGTRRVRFKAVAGKLEGSEVWESKAISPYYNDLVVHEGHAYGFDGEFLTCIDLEDGSKKWRQRGYGNGQVLLLPDQGLVLVQAEKSGEVALIEATPDGHKSKGKFKWTDAKTWNHPVVAHGKLYLRNGKEMACYDLR